MKTITLRNDFHNTETRVKAGELSVQTVARVRRALCSVHGCTCGNGELNTRGPQEADIELGRVVGVKATILVSPKQ